MFEDFEELDNSVRKLRIEAGLTQGDLAAACGIAVGTLIAVELGYDGPFKKNGQPTKAASALCSYFGETMGTLYPNDVCSLSLDADTSSIEETGYNLDDFIGDSDDGDCCVARHEVGKFWKYIDEILVKRARGCDKRLERYRAVIHHRVCDGASLADVGQELNLTAQRIRSIEADVLRIFRNPKYDLLREFAFGDRMYDPYS